MHSLRIRTLVVGSQVLRVAEGGAVDAETRKVLPSGEIAAWSERMPSTGVRQAILPVATSSATTSEKLGREA